MANKYIIIEKEIWTNKQRQGSSLHEISYRGSYKSELPKFFIEKYSKEGDIVYDPFAGRGTTCIESVLLKRVAISNDINPLSLILTKPRVFIPSLIEVENRLNEIPIIKDITCNIDLSMFFHKDTLAEILSYKNYFSNKKCDYIDDWVRMVLTNRLTGHSKGFLSVYTLPPQIRLFLQKDS